MSDTVPNIAEITVLGIALQMRKRIHWLRWWRWSRFFRDQRHPFGLRFFGFRSPRLSARSSSGSAQIIHAARQSFDGSALRFADQILEAGFIVGRMLEQTVERLFLQTGEQQFNAHILCGQVAELRGRMRFEFSNPFVRNQAIWHRNFNEFNTRNMRTNRRTYPIRAAASASVALPVR